MNDRRKLLVALGASVIAAPLSSFAQHQGKIWRVGFLSQRQVSISDTDYYYGPFRQAMRELGYVEGKNLVIEWRSAEGHPDRLPGLAAELVRLKVDVLITPGTQASRAAQSATTTIPIVILGAGDPLGSGLVKSLAHPGGNLTGLTNLNPELGPKLLEMLLAISPKPSLVAVLWNSSNAGQSGYLKNIQAAAHNINVMLVSVGVNTSEEIAGAFSTMIRQKAEAVVVAREPLFQQQKSQIVDLASKYRMPSIGGYREYAEAGGLMSYGPI